MTAEEETTDPATDPEAADTVAGRLLVLQRLDTEADQLRIRRKRLAERDAHAARSAALTEWEQRRAAMRARIDELTAAMETAEERGARLRADKQRLEAQLKTVIAPREAEALMHEIAAASEQLDEVDTQEFADLSEATTTEEALAAHLGDEEALRAALGHADDALARAVADIDRELADIDERRGAARDGVEPADIEKYDRIRGALGVAVAQLVGHRCDGCHLDLSAAEIDTAKEEAASTGVTDCPQCGRMLAV